MKKSYPPGTVQYDILNNERLTFGVGRSVTPGCFTIEVTHHSFCGPLGIVWYRFTKNSTCLDVLNSYVDSRYRRLGIRTLLNKKLFEFYPTIQKISTDGGSQEGGTAFLKASGYIQLSYKQGWELRRKK